MTFVRKVTTRLPIISIRVVGAEAEEKKNGVAVDVARADELSAEIKWAEAISADAVAQTRAVVETLIQTIDELEDRRSKSYSELRMAAIEIGVLVASRIVYEKIEANDYPFEALVNKALEKLDPNVPVTIRLHPEDQSILNERIDGEDINEVIKTVTFESDVTISRGSCRADTADFGLVSTIEQRTEEIRELLLQGIDDAQTERRKNGTSAQPIRRFPDRRETA